MFCRYREVEDTWVVVCCCLWGVVVATRLYELVAVLGDDVTQHVQLQPSTGTTL